MANVATLGARASFDVSGFNAGVNKMMDGLRAIKAASKDSAASVDKVADTTESAAVRMKNSFLAGAAGGAAMGAALGTLQIASDALTGSLKALGNAGIAGLKWGAQLAMEAEQAEISFEVMFKSAGKARQMMADIEDFAIRTPFDAAGLTDNIRLLKGMGIANRDLLPAMKTLGDLSLGNRDKLGGLALAYGQVMAKGKLMAQEFNQLAERGINLRDDLANNLGIAVQDVAKAMEEGRISANVFRNALIDLAERDFGGMMERQTDTIKGKLDKLAETGGLVFKGLAKELMDAFDIRATLDGVIDRIEKLRGLAPLLEENRNAIPAAAGMLATGANIATTGSPMFGVAAAGLTGAGLAAVSAGNATIDASAGALRRQQMREGLQGVGGMAAGGVMQASGFLSSMLGERGTKFLGGMMTESLTTKQQGEVFMDRLGKLFSGGGLKGLERVKDDQPTMMGRAMADAFKGGIGDTLRSLIGTGANLGQTLMVKGLKGTAFLQDAAGSMFAETPRQDMERKTGALEVGSSSAYSEIIKHMFGGRNKESIDAKQLAEMKRTADGIAKLSQDLLTKGFKAFGVVNNLAGAGA